MRTARWMLLMSVAAGLGWIMIRGSGMRRPMERRRTPRWHKSFTDINSAGPEELQKLGLDSVAAERIVENRPYRNKLELVSRMVIPENLYGTIRHHIGVRDTDADIKIA